MRLDFTKDVDVSIKPEMLRASLWDASYNTSPRRRKQCWDDPRFATDLLCGLVSDEREIRHRTEWYWCITHLAYVRYRQELVAGHGRLVLGAPHYDLSQFLLLRLSPGCRIEGATLYQVSGLLEQINSGNRDKCMGEILKLMLP